MFLPKSATLLLSTALFYSNKQGMLCSAFTPAFSHQHQLSSSSLSLPSLSSNDNVKIKPSPSTTTILHSTPSDEFGVSDYSQDDLPPPTKQLTVDTDEDDAIIRDELKRELLLLSSITNRGQHASNDESNIMIDIVTQLEALNPTPEPAARMNLSGEWDLCLTSTQAFRSSPFFQSIRAIFGGGDKQGSDGGGGDAAVAENAFRLHDAATSVGKVGRVRQVIGEDGTFVSEVDIEVGLLGGLPVVVKGTVVTSATYEVTGPETFDLVVGSTSVKRSNVPFLDQLLDDYPVEVPVGDIYGALRGSVPVAKLKTFYIDEAMRITRDQDDNFYVFCRS